MKTATNGTVSFLVSVCTDSSPWSWSLTAGDPGVAGAEHSGRSSLRELRLRVISAGPPGDSRARIKPLPPSARSSSPRSPSQSRDLLFSANEGEHQLARRCLLQRETSIRLFFFLLLTWAVRRGEGGGPRRKAPGVEPRDVPQVHLPPAVGLML